MRQNEMTDLRKFHPLKHCKLSLLIFTIPLKKGLFLHANVKSIIGKICKIWHNVIHITFFTS